MLLATPELLDEARFVERAAALDSLEVEILDPLRAGVEKASNTGTGSARPASEAALREVHDRAEVFRHRLEEVDVKLFERLRAKIRAGLRGPELRETLFRYAGMPRASPSLVGYDALDEFVAGLILPPPVPEASNPLEPGMVFYQPTPARVILELVDLIGADGEMRFHDIGSGLGLVPILVHLLTGVRAVGIEVEPSYHRYARARADDFGIASQVAFHEVDARSADYDQADILFLYTPFVGSMLEEVLCRVRDQAPEDVRIFSYGPCTPLLARQTWLAPRGMTDDAHALTMFTRAESTVTPSTS